MGSNEKKFAREGFDIDGHRAEENNIEYLDGNKKNLTLRRVLLKQ